MYLVRPSDPEVARAYDQLPHTGKEFFQERSAILEYESGLTRIEAEAEALVQTRAWLKDREAEF